MLEELFQNKAIKAKAKVSTIGEWIVKKDLPIDELIVFSDGSQASGKATCLEALEYATKKQPNIATEELLSYATKSLKDDAPRVKWEAAKIIGNISHLFPKQLSKSVTNLIKNAHNDGTVVRWATAYALGEILKVTHDKKLLSTLEALSLAETDNGVKKKYIDALKKIKR
jgi:hypothetical protein